MSDCPFCRPDAARIFHAGPLDWQTLAKARGPEEEWRHEHADLAASVQVRLEEMILELAAWLQRRTGERRIALAGGVALNCVANSRLWREGPFEDIWVQPASGDAGTALGGRRSGRSAGGKETAATSFSR